MTPLKQTAIHLDYEFLTSLWLKLEYSKISRSIPWLLMAWLLASPGHQQPCYERMYLHILLFHEDQLQLALRNDRKRKSFMSLEINSV